MKLIRLHKAYQINMAQPLNFLIDFILIHLRVKAYILDFSLANSKLRRDLSIRYLQAGRLPEAKEQVRKAEELQAKRPMSGRL